MAGSADNVLLLMAMVTLPPDGKVQLNHLRYLRYLYAQGVKTNVLFFRAVRTKGTP